MQTDYIDLYWLHNWDIHTPIDETMAALEDLVRAGKVRYLGVSDTPAWKVVEANVTARFRGWSAFIGLQIEYSLLERSVEQELVPMAREHGLGITPWSPLKSGALSGKYTRKNAGQIKADRGFFLDPFLNEKTYALVDELEAIAKAHDSTVARVALAWVQAQPGVTSTIIGARRLAQLEDNVKAVDVRLTAEELASPRRAHEADVRLSAEHAADVPGHPQRRDDGERRPGTAFGLRDGTRRQALLSRGGGQTWRRLSPSLAHSGKGEPKRRRGRHASPEGMRRRLASIDEPAPELTTPSATVPPGSPPRP